MKSQFADFKHHLTEHVDLYGLLLAIISLVFPPFLAFLGAKMWLIVSLCIGLIFLFSYFAIKAILKWQKYCIGSLIILFFGYIVFLIFYNPNPKIFDLTDGYSIFFEDSFENGNPINDERFPWIRKKDGFENGKGLGEFINSLTLKSGVDPEGKNAIYQNIGKFDNDVILIAKFYLKDKNSIGFDFIKENEPGTRGSSYQSCNVTTQSGKNSAGYEIANSLNYVDFFNGKKRDYAESQKGGITEGTYYLLAKISKGTLSCYSQKEGDESYKSIVNNVLLKMNELGGPKLIKYSLSDEPKPYLLNFKIYSK